MQECSSWPQKSARLLASDMKAFQPRQAVRELGEKLLKIYEFMAMEWRKKKRWTCSWNNLLNFHSEFFAKTSLPFCILSFEAFQPLRAWNTKVRNIFFAFSRRAIKFISSCNWFVVETQYMKSPARRTFRVWTALAESACAAGKNSLWSYYEAQISHRSHSSCWCKTRPGFQVVGTFVTWI